MKKTKIQIGQELEDKVFNKLKEIDNIKIFSNVLIPKRTGETTEIDVLAVHESGVYIIECKNFSGEIDGSVYEDAWYQKAKDIFLRGFYNPVKQNVKHKQHFLDFTKIENSGVRTIVVFDDRTVLSGKVRRNTTVMNFSQFGDYIEQFLNRRILSRKSIEHIEKEILSCGVSKVWR